MRTWLFAFALLTSVACGRVTAEGKPDATHQTNDAASTGGELCLNGTDDDGDDLADCADDDCAPAARCVPLPQNSNFTAGVVVAADEPCPPGFDGGETLIHRGLIAPNECTGCGCTASDSECVADVWYYLMPAECEQDADLTRGVFAGEYDYTCPNPISDGTVEGVRTEIRASATCTASGNGTPTPVSWSESKKFCRASEIGAGCASGSVCVAKQQPVDHCILTAGASTCDGYLVTESDWYTGVADTRTCGSCTCSATGDCSAVELSVGSDYGCVDAFRVASGSKTCERVYAPPVQLLGDPGPGSCTASAQLTGGTAAPTGETTLCCML